MRALSKILCATVATVGLLATLTEPSSAACTRLGFSVNDYGKDGPTQDAKDLLDKYIAKKMSERGVTNYRTGKKDVTCELFLNFIVFDEHTCRADATVCWDDTPLPKGEEAAAAPGKKPAVAKAAPPVAKATTTGSIEKPDAPAAVAAQPAASGDTSAAAVSADAAVTAAPTAVEASPAPVAESGNEKPDAAAATQEVAPVGATSP